MKLYMDEFASGCYKNFCATVFEYKYKGQNFYSLLSSLK